MILAPLALVFALGGPALRARALPVAAPMTTFEALDYLSTNRARLVADRRLETRLANWAWKSLGAAVLLPSLKHVPETLADYYLRHLGGGPLHGGSMHLYAFSLIGAIGAGLAVSSAYDLITLTPDLVQHARAPVRVPQLASLNHLLDLPDEERYARLTEDPAAAARVVALAELMRANPRMNLSSL